MRMDIDYSETNHRSVPREPSRQRGPDIPCCWVFHKALSSGLTVPRSRAETGQHILEAPYIGFRSVLSVIVSLALSSCS